VEGVEKADGRGPTTAPEERELDLLEYGAIIWRQRWVILAVFLVAVTTTTVITLRLPKIYVATATVLTPKDGGGSGLLANPAVAGLLTQVAGISFPSLTPNRDLVVAVIKSRAVAQGVVKKFQLQQRYRSPTLLDAIDTLQGATNPLVTREGLILLTVEDTDPQAAAEIANFYVEELDRVISRFGNSDAARQRTFVGEQVARAKKDLDGAENQLRRFQERNRAIVLQEQTGRVIAAAAQLKGEIMAADVQLQVMRNFATDANPEVVSVRRRIEEMRRQLAQIEYGDGSAAGSRRGGQTEMTIPFARVPELGLELARLTREVKVQETLVTLLSQQYEQARITEARETPSVQVLDAAVPALRPSKPSLRFNLVIAGTTSLFVGFFLAFIVDYFRSIAPARRRARPA
jgi:uncharacterized protein involved in exopolysaccharide biosynthesis